MAPSSAKVMGGSAIGVVVRTGDRCTIGMIANLASAPIGVDSTLKRNVEHFVRLIAILAICMATVFFIISLIRYGTGRILNLIVSSFIVVLVANVPEVYGCSNSLRLIKRYLGSTCRCFRLFGCSRQKNVGKESSRKALGGA